jgi:hypothetical protein
MVALALLELTPLSTVTPGAGASLEISALDTQVSENGAPVRPAERFTAGFSRIYFFVTHRGMQPGVLWRRELWRDGELVQTALLPWGQSREGVAFFYFGVEGGFRTGDYEIRLSIGESGLRETRAEFTVMP